MRWIAALLLVALLGFAAPRAAHAGFTQTLPKSMFMLNESYVYAWLDHSYDNHGDLVPIIEDIERFEPGGGMQGILSPNPHVEFQLLVTQLQYGLFDWLTLAIAVPLVMKTTVDLELKWTPGDYQNQLGRPYSESDFWQWAGSFGQPQPQDWTGNEWTLSDIVLGARWRFTDHMPWFEGTGWSMALMIMASIPTGSPADPEEVVTAGTTLWDLHTQGDLAFHLGVDKRFDGALGGRLTLGVDVFYEHFWPRSYETPSELRHPLLLNIRPYVGHTYELQPGDFSGVSVQADVVPFKGPARGTWLTGGDATKAAGLPPMLTVSLLYSFVHLQQSDWTSQSDLWDWNKERLWRVGYKNFVGGQLVLSLLRLGVPTDLLVTYKTLELIPGKNCRAANNLMVGLRVPLKFW